MRPVWLTLGITILASLARAQAPAVNANGVLNDASFFAPGGVPTVSPGSIVAIFGTNLASTTLIGDTIPLSTALDTVTSVTFNGVPAGLYFVSSQQINAQLPFEALVGNAVSGTVDVVVSTNAGTSAPQTVNVEQTLPGIFTVNQRGFGQAIATDNNTGVIAAPAGSISGITTAPISKTSGHALIIWCTGMGAVTPPLADGANSFNPDGTFTLRNTVLQPPALEILIGGVKAQYFSSVLSPQFVSEYQIGVLPDPTTPTGDAISVQISVNGVATSDQVTIAVAP